MTCFGYSYRHCLIWQSNAIAYLYPSIYALESAELLTAAYSPWMKSIQLRSLENDPCECEYLCESLQPAAGPSTVLTSAAQLPDKIQLTKLQNFTGNVNVTVCPSGHVTHNFLSCDSSSACWASYLAGAQSCRVDLSPSPPSFSCLQEASQVSYSLVCDYREDCSDGSDEIFCEFPQCGEEMYRCINSQVWLLGARAHVCVCVCVCVRVCERDRFLVRL